MEISPGIYSLTQDKGFDVHAFLIDDSDDAGGLTLIDTLFDYNPVIIATQIRALGRPLSDLTTIILTHAHRSHLGGLAALKRLTGATVYAHEWEADIIAGERRAQSVSWLPQDPLVTWHYQIGNNLGLSSHPPCKVDRYLRGGEQLGSLEIIHTPGHSPGHLAFYHRGHRVLFTGDAVVTSPKFMGGWPAFTLNARQQAESLRRLATYDAITLAVGHGEPIRTGGQRCLESLLPRT